MEQERIHGLTLEDCAQIMGEHTSLRAQHGERDFKPYFQQALAQRGIDENTWAHGWNAWWTRMESDPSGQLHARYATFQQQVMMKSHFADVPDASQDTKAGVSLDQYARIMAKISGGEDANTLLAAEGVPMERWLAAQKEWNAAMAADVNHHLTTQYGTLYAKYTPGFQQQIEGATAAIMAADHAQRAAGRPDEPEKEYTFEDMVRELDDPTPATRWAASNHVCNQWDIGERNDPALQAAVAKAHTLLLEALERHDQFTVSDAERAGENLKMLAAEGYMSAEQASEAESAIGRCLNRGREQLGVLQAGFEPIKNKAVPERIKMQTAIQDYTSLVETLAEIESEWADNYVAPEAPSAAPSFPAASPAMPSSTAIEPTGGLMFVLKRLPVIGAILRLLGL